MAKPRPDSNWIGRAIGGRYKIEEYIAQGGMSAVFKASDPNLQRTVAIKLIHQHLSNDPEFVRRFEQEAAAVARLRHPNILQVYDFNHDDHIYYMVMEFVPGQTLKDKLKTLSAAHQRLPLKDIISIMTTLCEAAAYAHEQGMVHRDLKPANVMITPRDQVILMDFGVAKMLTGPDETATGAIIGTAKYMSPEQARGERPDARSDIYALGVMLYEMAVGQPPFDADTTVPILLKHVNEPVPDIRQIQKDIPDGLVQIIEKALAKKPDDRYQTAAQMAIALKLLARLGQTASPTFDSQQTVSSKWRQPAKTPAPPNPNLTMMTPASVPVSQAPEPASPAKSSSLKFWLIGTALVGLLLMAGLVGGLVFLFGPLSNGAYATGAEVAANNLPSSAGMVRIAAGQYTVGFDKQDRDHAPQQTLTLAEYWLDQHEVTNLQYTNFLTATDQPPPPTWSNGVFPDNQADFPVMGITWNQAKAYCEWANKRLPTEAEWEVAARGAEDRLFPWGDNPQAVALPRSGTYAVGTKLTNQSPFGVFDMAGNVWEWVDAPYVPVPADQHVLRGGTNDFLKDMAYRLIGDPSVATMSATAGMRCAADKVNMAPEDMLAENVYFEDSFINPGSGWPILAEGAFFYGYHPPDYYHMEVATTANHAVVTHPPNFENVTVVASVLVDHTTTPTGDFRYGLVLRRTGPDQYYAFTISPRAKMWYILKSSAKGLEVLKQGPVDSLKGLAPPGVTPDKTDGLQVDASGPTFVLRINGQPVAQIDDADYSNGEVGFYVETFDESLAHIHYDTLTVEKVESLPVEVAGSAILYGDQFTDPASGWPTEDKEGEPFRYGYHPPDYYHIEARAADAHVIVTLPQAYQDATVETAVLVDHTGTDAGNFRYGLVLRRTDDKFYAFTISPRQKKWEVIKSTPYGIETLAEGPLTTLHGLATPAGTDKLRVDAVGSEFNFLINDQSVIQVTDADFPSGEIGFYEENFDETVAHIHYESLTISKVAPEISAGTPKTESQ
jgi:serine/threonine protein kinase